MSLKHVILRTPGLPAKATPFIRGPAPGFEFREQDRNAESLPFTTELSELALNAAARLAEAPEVAAIAPVMPLKLIEPFPGTDSADSDAIAWGIRAVGADRSPWTGEGVVVAVLDTGIDPNHEAFAGVELVRRNFTPDGDDDDIGHGTHCAGTILGRDVTGRRIGVARGVKRAVIGKVLGSTPSNSAWLASAIQWALEQGAHVISMSLGIDFPGYVRDLIEKDGYPADLATSVALSAYRANVTLFESLVGLAAAREAFAQPSIIVAAAGNESRRDENPKFEIEASPPAVASGFLSVAALGRTTSGAATLTVAPFSNYGAVVSGPGVDVESAKRGSGLTLMSGTSMATPHVAGVAALWAQKLRAEGSLSSRRLHSSLEASAVTSVLQSGFDPSDVGAGLVQAPTEQSR